MLAVQKAAKDMSPYVRKAAAFAIPKIMRLDARHLEQCTELISTLLADNSTMVVGAAAQAFMEVCPDRFDLIHPVFRHMCNLLPDVDEWGQVSIVNLLLRYGRTQFVNPDPLVQKAIREKHAAENPNEAPKEKTEFVTVPHNTARASHLAGGNTWCCAPCCSLFAGFCHFELLLLWDGELR